MAGIKELRLRITSIGNIKQITRAMEMVATTKLRRFQDRATASRPYAEEISGLMGRLTAVLGEEIADRPLFQRREGGKKLALIVSSDRGLCGAYNTNLFRALEEWRGRQSGELRYFVYGRKAFQYMHKREFEIDEFLTEPALEAIDYRNAAITARMLVRAFESGEYSEVWMLYTAFESMSRYVPTWVQFLPIEASALPQSEGEHSAGGDVLFEPDPVTVFDHLVPRYLETRIYNALLEALTSEYASRRFAMKNATDAATDMQKVLRGIYNRKRQETITKELLDIVGGAEAVS
jgi:F-type H+-transporting ATPase subunit gamma